MAEKVLAAEWLTKDYFRSLYQRKSPESGITVKNVTLEYAEQLERIHGKMVRAVVDLSTSSGDETRSYIVKIGTGDFYKTPAGVNTCRMEILMLEKIIPAMEEKLKEFSLDEFVPLAPRLIDSGTGKNVFILEEDLSIPGFKTESRRKGLDLSRSLVYVKYLAAFHAASVAVLDKFQEEILSIPLLSNSKESDNTKRFINNSVERVIAEIKTWDNSKEFLGKIEEVCKSLPENLAKANRYHPRKLNVICHGDMFINNILFQGSNMRLVDFELSRIGSFADDITGFVHSCLDEETLGNHSEELFEEYRKNLNICLERMGLQDRQLSRDDLWEELRLQRDVTLFSVFHMLPHARTPGEIDLSSGEVAFAAPEFKRLLRLLIPMFEQRGWLKEQM